MAKLINTIITDAKEGSYVSRRAENPYNIEGLYPPCDYQRAVKEVWHCYDNGSIFVSGIGDTDIEEDTNFVEGDNILQLHRHVNFYDEVSALNDWLSTLSTSDVLDSIDNDEWSIRKDDLAPKFKELVEYIRNLNAAVPPEPFMDLGFYYCTEKDDDGNTTYFIVAVVEKEYHKQVEFRH